MKSAGDDIIYIANIRTYSQLYYKSLLAIWTWPFSAELPFKTSPRLSDAAQECPSVQSWTHFYGACIAVSDTIPCHYPSLFVHIHKLYCYIYCSNNLISKGLPQSIESHAAITLQNCRKLTCTWLVPWSSCKVLDALVEYEWWVSCLSLLTMDQRGDQGMFTSSCTQYPLVMTNIAIEYGYWNSEFSH